MFTDYIKEGVKAGGIGGLFYGLFVALVGNNLIRYAETFEHGHGEAASLTTIPSAPASIGGGILWGLLLGGLVFGVVYYFLEPVIPGYEDTKIYLLGCAGFITISGAPWLVLPPQPPGVEQGLPTETRLLMYIGMMIAGALVCGLAGAAYNRLRENGRIIAILGGIAAFVLLAIPIIVAPANPTSGAVPTQFVWAFQWVTAFGQATLWVVMASSYVWITRRTEKTASPVSPDSFEPVANPDT